MKYRVIIFILAVSMMGSCSDWLDKSPEEDITVQEAFLQRNYAEAFLTSGYAAIPIENYFTDWADVNPFILASDEMAMPWPEKFGKLMNRGAWNPYNTAGQFWINMYESIRKLNIFLENIHITPFSDEFKPEDKERWINEAILLRAFFHFINLRIYGPIPIVDFVMHPDYKFDEIKRRPLDECIDFIVKACDDVKDKLPARITNNLHYGRMTGTFAYALKARVLLYRASPLFNGNIDYIGFANKDGELLFPQTADSHWWSKAATAAKEAIDKCSSVGFELFKAGNGDPVEDYSQLFLKRWNNEVIMATNNSGIVQGWVERSCFPRGFGGWSGYCPTQRLVDAYEMANGEIPITGYRTDGSPIINPASGYEEEGYAVVDDPDGKWLAGVRNMYVGRDPRFYATVTFNGAWFKDRKTELWFSGADGRREEGRDYALTGYLMRKWVDMNVDIPRGNYSLKTWIFFRMGGLYLDYAEALNEAEGPVTDVHKYVNMVRERAGMPNLPASLNKDQMRERIRRERQVELSFETHRYFDCHRWKIAHETDNGPVYGMNIMEGTHLQDDVYYKRTEVETRVFNTPVHYLFPIMQREMDKAPGLVQNPGW